MQNIPELSTVSVDFDFPVPKSPRTTITIRAGLQRSSINVVDSSDPYPCLLGLFNAVADGYSSATELTDGNTGHIVRVMLNADTVTAKLHVYQVEQYPRCRASEIDANVCIADFLSSFSQAYRKLATVRNGPDWIPVSLSRIESFVAERTELRPA